MSSRPPSELVQVARLTEARLARMFDSERERWSRIDPRLAEAVDELSDLTSVGGKRLRAAFCYWSFVAAAPAKPVDDAINTAAACELLQTFALIHDDIMDNAKTRRGRQTIHTRHQERVVAEGWRGEPRRYGEGVALLIGDLSHVYADRLLGDVSPETRDIWDELRIELNLGQYLDMRSSAASENDRATAQQVVMFKSALYTIVRPLQLGASTAGRNDPELHRALAAFGQPVGTAFQLRDDLLGLLSNEAELGKPIGSDLREGKSTELLAVALENADQHQLAKLSRIGEEDLTDSEVADLVTIFHDTESIRVVELQIEQLIRDAEKAARTLPYAPEHRKILIDLGHYVAERTY